MASYRMYFLGQTGIIQGRDDFEAESDESAIVIAEMLCAACSDVSDSFELWQGTRRLDTSSERRRALSAKELADEAQETVLQREIAIRDGRWLIANSRQLVEQTRRLLQKTAH